MENIEKIEASDKVKVQEFHDKVLSLLKKIPKEHLLLSEPDSFSIGDLKQAVVFTNKNDNSKISIFNNLDSIIIKQDGKEQINFSSPNREEEALAKIQEIIDNL